MNLKHAGEDEVALLVLTLFVCYLRPSEGSGLLRRDLHLPASGTGDLQFHTLTLGARETEVPTKTNVFDDSVPLDHPAWLGALVAQRCAKLAPLAPLFQVEHQVLVAQFKAAVERLRLPATHLYQCRHGGASDDALAHRRDSMQIMARGRWQTIASVRRYSKAAQVQKYLALVGQKVRRYCQFAEANLQGLLQGTVAPLPPPCP
jgi:hypothetical protein